MKKVLSIMTIATIALSSAYAMSGQFAQAAEVTLYKNPQCQCCEGHAQYLRRNGFTVTVTPTHELSAMSRKQGIPDDFQGCHLAFIDKYVVSGHVPVKTVNKLLTEKPDIKGVTLPGMPMGSPGMSGRKTAPFKIMEISKSGAVNKIYATE
ncbi:MAG: metal-binding protein [Blastopirellula sp.]|nr:MAG: metal-binding protein [Blastopirellula sp.]